MPNPTAARERRASPGTEPGDEPEPRRVELHEVDGLYRRHAARLRGKLRCLVRGSDDLIDDACSQAWTILLTARPHHETVFAWLVTVARHEAWHLAREDAECAPLQLGPDAGYAPDVGVAASDPLAPLHARERLRAVAATLPDRQRHLVALQALGYSYAEIGGLTGDSYTAVNRQLARAYRRLDPLREPLT